MIDFAALHPSITALNVGDMFNQILHNIDTMLPSLTHLTLGCKFNQPITIPTSITHLVFGGDFDQPVTLPNSLVSLKFGNMFNQPITLPKSLIYVAFGANYSKPLDLSSSSLEYLKFKFDFNASLSLPSTLKRLKFGRKFNQRITIPLSLTHLTFGRDFNQPLYLPPSNSITHLVFGHKFNQPLPEHLPHLIYISHSISSYPINIPASALLAHEMMMENITVSISQSVTGVQLAFIPKNPLDLSSFPNIKTIFCCENVGLPIATLPPRLNSLSIENSDEKVSFPLEILPSTLTDLEICGDFNQPIDNLPYSLTSLRFGVGFNQPVDHLPPHLTHLELGDSFNHPLNNLPAGLQYLRVGRGFLHTLQPPPSVIELDVDLLIFRRAAKTTRTISLRHVQTMNIRLFAPCYSGYLLHFSPWKQTMKIKEGAYS